jgi:hypothetical protein
MMHILDGHVKTAEIDWKTFVERGVETRGISVKVLRFSHRGQSSMAVILVLFGSCLLFRSLGFAFVPLLDWWMASGRVALAAMFLFTAPRVSFGSSTAVIIGSTTTPRPGELQPQPTCASQPCGDAGCDHPISGAAVSGIAMASGIGRLRSRAAQAPFCSKC